VLLAVDVGNTNVTLALFDGDRLAADWRVSSHRERTADEMAVELRQLVEVGRETRQLAVHHQP